MKKNKFILTYFILLFNIFLFIENNILLFFFVKITTVIYFFIYFLLELYNLKKRVISILFYKMY